MNHKENHWTLIDSSQPHFEAPSLPESIAAGTGAFRVSWHPLRGGKSESLHALTIDTGAMRTILLPERGMSIWKCWAGDTEIGWQSPVHGPVHPSWVPIHDPSGLGWLEGFDELFVRCGLESNGAPEFHPQGTLRYPLHGRIANLPARQLTLDLDPVAGTLDVRGWVDETRFLIRNLSLQVHYQFRVHQPSIAITDTVTNQSSNPTSMQLLYHINVGQPILEAGATLQAPIKKLAPRNPHAAKDVDRWSTYPAPSPGYVEQVYFSEPLSNAQGWTTTMLCDSRKERGLVVRFETKTLPYLTLWKNTAAVEDGYVTGIEPGTGFPNTRSFEESKGRVITLAGGESRRFRLQIEGVTSSTRTAEVMAEIQGMQIEPTKVLPDPDSHWAS